MKSTYLAPAQKFLGPGKFVSLQYLRSRHRLQRRLEFNGLDLESMITKEDRVPSIWHHSGSVEISRFDVKSAPRKEPIYYLPFAIA